MPSTQEPSPYAILEERLAYSFRDTALVETALTHRSWLNETLDAARADNERLEFLGDAVLALVSSDLLMKRFPEQSEGELSKARAALVNEAGLARVADAVGLGQWIFLGHGEAQAGGRQKRSLLANTFEALVGAIYLDGGYSAAFRVAERLMEPLLADVPAAANKDFKSRLQELAQGRLQMTPSYAVLSESGPDHAKTFEVAITIGDKEYGRGFGRSKKEAQQSAAEIALAIMEAE
ncbi:MAG: ribonuclease III [Deltaproteobacteria bacterium]|nr:ribonuclease III [Deltaproteobacteria bacterium]